MELDDQGRRLLSLLVSLLPSVDPERPNKMIGYKDVHEYLNLPMIRKDWGTSLLAQGLANLAEWTKANDKPAITGLIVNQTDHSPGPGYFSLFERENDDWHWWRSQIISSKRYNWNPDVTGSSKLTNFANVSALFENILRSYPTAAKEPFASHPLAAVLRDELPKLITRWIKDPQRYFADGSAGRGVWANVPWIAIMDRLITDTVQEGYYLVYLFDVQHSSLYLSINQGVTSVKTLYGSGTAQALRARAQDMLSRLGDATKNLHTGPIDLSAGVGSLGVLYESGSVCSMHYPVDQIPTEENLCLDFQRFLLLYEELAARDERLLTTADAEDDEIGLDVEDARTLREHKRIERNRRLSEKAKKHHGYICKACGFDFEKRYGSIGKSFIEAHHLIPLSKLKGQVVSLNAERDFTVLCSNCHRMIHKTDTVGDVREFRSHYIIEY